MDNLSKITELRQERASVLTGMRSIIDLADADKRERTAEENQELSKREARFDALTADISLRERMESNKPNTDLRADVAVEPEARKSDVPYHSTDEYRDAFLNVLFRGSRNAELRAALNVGTDANGGFLVPTLLQTGIIEIARVFGVIRQIANVITTETGADLNFSKEGTHTVASWTAEAASATESEPTFAQVVLKAQQMSVLSKASFQVLRDANTDLEGFLKTEFGEARALLENTAFWSGDGSGKPTGLLDSTNGLSSGRFQTGAVSATAEIKPDELIDLYHGVKPVYRAKGTWVMADDTLKAVSKLKDTQNRYLFQEGLIAGDPDTIKGRPVLVDPDAPAMAVSAKGTILFGDWKRGYYVRDVSNTATFRALQELYAVTNQLGFLAFYEVDGHVIDETALVGYTHGAAS